MFKLSVEETLKKLNSNLKGLSQKQVEQLKKEYGVNELKKAKKQSFIKCFFKQFLNIMVAILLVSAVVSISIALVHKQYGDLFEGFVILFIVFMNAIIGVLQESKAQACIDDLQKFCKTNVKVWRGGVIINIDSTLLVPGDIVELEAGNIAQADIRLIYDNNLACDESLLTGESVPVEKNSNVILPEGTPLAERKNMVYSGSMIVRGKATGVVVATANNTEIGKIANILFNTKKETTPLQKSIDKIGKIITWTVLAICALILVFELIVGNGVMNAIMISVSLAVAAIPESLPAVITIILALGVQQLAKRKCIIRHLNAVETLGSCEVICTDKTGTLTMNKIQVVETYSNWQTNEKSSRAFEEMLKCMVNCNDAKLENKKVVGEPTEAAIYEFALSCNKMTKMKIVHEIPFNSNRKMMSVIVNEDGLKSYVKGAPEVVLNKCTKIMIDGKIQPLTKQLREKLNIVNNDMSDKAYRVMAFACKTFDVFNPNIDIEEELVFLGLSGMMDNPRPEVEASIEKCVKAGLKPVMITGDHKRTAFAIAKQLGIASCINEVMTGAEIDKLTNSELVKVCGHYSVFARVSPEHKVRIVQAFKNLKKIVAMTGDGVNDAPSLKIADIGVGMGKSGTDVVKNVADMVVTDDNFSSIIIAVEEGRKVYSNIQKALQFLISTNCVEVFGMLISLMIFPHFTFLLPVQMLFINLVTDSLPAFALGMEKVEPEVMLSPPRDKRNGLFSGKVGVAIIYQSILQTFIVMVVFVVGVLCYAPEKASTMVFFTIIFMQTLHSINCKTNNNLSRKNLFDNKVFNLCFSITMILNLFVACVPFVYPLFGLTPLNASQWILVIIASILIIPACELFKCVLSNQSGPRKRYFKNRLAFK